MTPGGRGRAAPVAPPALPLLPLLVLLTTVLALLLAAAPGADAAPRRAPQPVLTGDFPDPTIAQHRGRWIAVATGSMAPRAVAPSPGGPWRRVSAALGSLPPWAVDDAIWASDLVRVGRRWRLYFSAPVAGLAPGARCIGVAVAPSPLAEFVPAPEPLVCPAGARRATAPDQVNPPGVPLPSGVIDPDLHESADGSLLLTYRTQGVPSSIRAVPLDVSGSTATQPTSTTLVVSAGVVENPVLVQRGATWVLITSEGYFGSCDYQTTFQRAASLEALSSAPRELLARSGRTGLCGPGGADLVGTTMFLHGWTCPAGSPRCRVPTTRRQDGPSYAAKRSLYAARLRWSAAGEPRLVRWLGPRRGTGVVASRRDPIKQTGLFPVPTGPGAELPVTTPLVPSQGPVLLRELR